MAQALIFVIFTTFSTFSIAEIEDFGVTKSTLENGLKIIVKVDNRAPVFISQLWYKVGSSDEHSGLTGISHMLEHMMFKGSSKYPAGEFSKIIAKNGGTDNAFTSRDYSAYYQKMHKSKLALSLELEADRMQNLVLQKTEFEKERKVVIEERRLRIEDNPNAKVYEHLQLISFAQNSGYYAPIIGFQNDIENYKLEDLQDWYQQFYAPNNATLVVVGDVNPGEVLALARRYFGEYKSNSNLQKSAKLAIPLKANSKILRLKAKLPLYVLGFHTPSLKTAERPKTAYSLEMLAYVLDNGLAKTLIRNKQIATNISLNYRLYSQFDGLFTLSFTPAEGVSSENVLAEIKKQVAKLINQPHLITAELSRIKAQLEAEFIFQQDQISTQAYYLGTLATVGLGVEELFSYVDKMNEITAAEVIHAAKIYLNFAAANSVELIAEGL